MPRHYIATQHRDTTSTHNREVEERIMEKQDFTTTFLVDG